MKVRVSIDPKELEAFVRDAASAIWRLDPYGRVLDLTEWCALTGQTLREARGTGWTNAVHQDDRPRAAAAWSTARDHLTPYNVDYRLRCADGMFRWFNARSIAVCNADGAASHWFGMMLAIAGPQRSAVGAPAIEPSKEATRGQLDPSIIRAARAMLGWSAQELCERSGVSVSTIRRLEQGERDGQSRRTSTDRLMRAFQGAGLRFTNGDGAVTGVRWKKGS